MPKISIIVPIYNVEPYLNKCIDSILAQTFTDFELILVDDGSIDNCPTICDEYAAKDERIVVIHKKNGGLSDARNTGLDIARGEYVGFVDGDDFIHPQMYDVMYKTVISSNAEVAQCEFYPFYEHENLSIENISLNEKGFSLHKTKDLIESFFPNNRYVFSSTVCNKLYSRNIFTTIRFPVGLYYEDSYIQLNVLEATNVVAIISKKLYYYLQRDGSIMHSEYSPKWFQGTHNNNNNIHFFREKGFLSQVEYALDDFLTRFSKDKFAVYLAYPGYKKEFREVEKSFFREFFPILKSSRVCRLKKLFAVCLLVSTSIAYHIAEKYFPECIYPFMRLEEEN